MKPLISTISVYAVIILFAVGYWLYDKKKKKKERLNSDPTKLRLKLLGKSFDLPQIWNQEFEDRFINWIQTNKGRLIRGDDGSWIVYFNERGKSQFTGFIRIPEQQLPFRLLLSAQDGKISLRLDEDWGIQWFVGKVKAEFKKRYLSRFEVVYQELKTL